MAIRMTPAGQIQGIGQQGTGKTNAFRKATPTDGVMILNPVWSAVKDITDYDKSMQNYYRLQAEQAAWNLERGRRK